MADRVAAFRLRITSDNNTKKTLQQIAELELMLDGVNKRLREAKKQGDQETYAKLRTESKVLRTEVNKLNKEFREQVKTLNAANFPEDSLIGLRNQYRLLRKEIDQLDKEQRQSDFGQNLIREAKQVKTQIKEIGASVGDLRDNVGNYQESIVEAFQASQLNIGNFLGGLTAAGAITQGLDLLVEGAQIVREITAEFTKLRGEVQQVTNATGQDLDRFTSGVAAIAETFQVDVGEALRAANSLTQQLTGDFDESLKIIETGFLSGANANGELLDSLREYTPFINEAKISTEEFIQILQLSNEQGIFNDKGIDTIKEATLRLRELPKATQEALEGIGISAEEIRASIDEKGIGEAIRIVSKRLSELQADSPEVGRALADIFGAPGEDAGLQFITSLQNVDGNINNLIDTSNEYIVQQQTLLELNKQFTAAQNELAKELGSVDGSLNAVSVQVKTALIDFVIIAIRRGKELIEIIRPLTTALGGFFNQLGLVDSAGRKTEKTIKILSTTTEIAQFPLKILTRILTEAVEGFTFLAGKVQEFLQFVGLASDKQTEIDNQVNESAANTVGRAKGISEAFKILGDTLTEDTKSAADAAKDAIDNLNDTLDDKAAEMAKSAIEILTDQINKLKKEAESAPNRVEAYKKLEEAETAEAKLKALRIELGLLKDDIQTLSTVNTPLADTIIKAITDAEQKLTDLRNEAGGRIDLAGIQLEQAAQLENEREFLQAIDDLRERNAERDKQRQIETAKEVQEATEKINQERQDNIVKAVQASTELTTDLITGEIETFKDFSKAILEIALQALEKSVLLTIAEAQAKSLAQADSIATFGATGIARGLVLTALIKGVFAGIRGAVSSFAEGGEIQGRSHAQGGVPMMVRSTGQRVELEGGEGVINKRSMASNDILTLKGTPKQIASRINSHKGFGVRFQEGGIIETQTPQLINPNQPLGNNQSEFLSTLSQQIARIESAIVKGNEGIENGVFNATKQGIGIGLNDASRRMEREEILQNEINT